MVQNNFIKRIASLAPLTENKGMQKCNDPSSAKQQNGVSEPMMKEPTNQLGSHAILKVPFNLQYGEEGPATQM